MRRFEFAPDTWEQKESPRRYRLTLRTFGICRGLSSVVVWEKVTVGESGPEMKPADVDVTLVGDSTIKIESSYRFDGEVRVAT